MYFILSIVNVLLSWLRIFLNVPSFDDTSISELLPFAPFSSNLTKFPLLFLVFKSKKSSALLELPSSPTILNSVFEPVSLVSTVNLPVISLYDALILPSTLLFILVIKVSIVSSASIVISLE